MWNPPPHVTDHEGNPSAPDSNFFADPPLDIGPIRTAYTSLKQGVKPKSWVMRLAIALAWGAGLEVLVLMVDQATAGVDPRTGFISQNFKDVSDPPISLVLLPVAILPAAISWYKTRFSHTCNYVGENGLAQFTCKRAQEKIRKRWHFLFKNATSMMTKRTDHYRNRAYTHTSFGFGWYSLPRVKPVFGITGAHQSGPANPPAANIYHFCRSAESAWYHYLAPLMEAELVQKGRITFYTGHNGWTALGPGFIEIADRHGKVSRFLATEIGTADLVNYFWIARPGVELNPFDFSSREGVYRFDQPTHNLPIFRYFFERCLAVRGGSQFLENRAT